VRKGRASEKGALLTPCKCGEAVGQRVASPEACRDRSGPGNDQKLARSGLRCPRFPNSALAAKARHQKSRNAPILPCLRKSIVRRSSKVADQILDGLYLKSWRLHLASANDEHQIIPLRDPSKAYLGLPFARATPDIIEGLWVFGGKSIWRDHTQMICVKSSYPRTRRGITGWRSEPPRFR